MASMAHNFASDVTLNLTPEIFSPSRERTEHVSRGPL